MHQTKRHTLAALIASALMTISPAIADDIIHDGEYEFVKAQYAEQWAAEDKQVDTKLAEIRTANGGNILYVLIDDVSFGQMGDAKMNYVMGIKTPKINQLSQEGLNLMRMYTEPSCTPTRAAFRTGRHPVRTGLKEVKVALVGEGLPGDEVTIAEELGLELDARSNVKAEYGKFKTSIEGVFAAGDMRRGQSLIVWAINEGRAAARECDEFLMGSTKLP